MWWNITTMLTPSMTTLIMNNKALSLLFRGQCVSFDRTYHMDRSKNFFGIHIFKLHKELPCNGMLTQWIGSIERFQFRTKRIMFIMRWYDEYILIHFFFLSMINEVREVTKNDLGKNGTSIELCYNWENCFFFSFKFSHFARLLFFGSFLLVLVVFSFSY